MTTKMIEKTVSAERYVAEYAHEAVAFYLYFFVGFLVPFTLGHPQLLVGTVVNAVLVVSALELRSMRHLLPLLFAPSIGVLARGLIFGPFTPFLAMMLPFIWVGNAILVFGVREVYKRRGKNFGIALGISTAAKSGFLFSVAFVLVSLSVLPALFLAAMGIVQLETALAGGLAGFGLYKAGVSRFLGRSLSII